MSTGSSDNSEDAQGVGLANPQLSQGRRRMLDLVNRLHSTGVQVDIDLPQVAVIGSQSAGKSSLIESISGITLPRAAGTCTRCPTECRLSRSDIPWQCVVSLRFITDSKGQPVGQARNEVFGPPIDDKAEVEERIRRAQRAILNPSKPAKGFLTGDDEDPLASELSFSFNCVSLQISGPDVADLSFCDLPGLIASVSSGRGNNNDIALVESLVTAYIKKSSCIILLTVACETDFENQGAHRLAKQHDPEGKRTIGVLTKPDRIPFGEEGNWLPFIRNEKETLENNWYCVKQPSSNDLKQKITWTEARQKEHEFFSMTAPWSDLDPVYQKYLRTSNLVERLSSILSDLISKRLPQIQEELERSTIKTRTALHSLPRPPSNDPCNEISTLIHKFSSDLARHVQGVPDSDGLLQTIRPAQDRFRRAIRSTAPNFRPFEREYAGKRHMGRATFLVQEEGQEFEDEASEDEDEHQNEEQSGEDSDEDSDDGQDAEHTVRKQVPVPSAAVRGHGARVGQKRKRSACDDKIYIDEVLERAYRARTRELPGNFPFVVQQTFIEAFIGEWHGPAKTLCATIHHALTNHVMTLIHKHFAEFGRGHLEQRIRTILQQHIKQCLANAEAKISWLVEMEEQPFSLNDHYLSDYKSKFLAHFKGSRQKYFKGGLMENIALYSTAKMDSRNPSAPDLDGTLAGLVALGIPGVRPEDLTKLLPSDKMEPALVIMADVRAYFQVAYKRFADMVPLAIDLDLVRGVEKNVLNALYKSLGVTGPDGQQICRELAQESPKIADRRADLLRKLERLETAGGELLHIGA